jgi:hypothetical protein
MREDLMDCFSKKRILCLVLCVSAVIFVVFSVSLAQEKSDEDLENQYAPILGEYEFVTGGGSNILHFYIEDGGLWADSGDGKPATLEPVEDEEFSFTAQDPITGEFGFKFFKDDQGEYTKCHLSNASMGMELEGIRIKKN